MAADLDVDLTALLAAARDGDQAAWDALVTRYTPLLWSIARGYRLDTADAADAVQLTWLRLVEWLGRIDDPERLPSWLSTTVRRECLHLLRRREQPTGVDDLLADLPADTPPIDSGLLLTERDAALWRALEALPAACQRLLRALTVSPPPSYAAVAAALGMPVGSIGPARQRCLGRLRQVLRGEGLLDAEPGGRR
ncbi:RNA polymerase sigma factor [Plantactinospora sp. CA-290183]|uniref:RNA polymerase sigma factor n=1 Tax=Plantactinospora sp. CA-290183 TaxID=3240006 RepID=UPI003D89EA94